MHFRDEEVDEGCPTEWRIERPVHLEAAFERADDGVGSHELDRADTVRRRLEPARCGVGPLGEDGRVAFAQEVEEIVSGARDATHFGGVGDDAPNAQHVVRIGGPLGRDAAAEDDLLGLFRGELRAFDVVREVRFEERQRRLADAIARLRPA